MSRENESWREMVSYAMSSNKDSWENVEANTMSEAEMDVMFYSGFGGVDGIPFTVWTHDWVYFPMCYDGSEWVGSVARNPNGEPTGHQGGG